MIVRYNIIIPVLKNGQKYLFVIIDGCLATRQRGLICHTLYNKTITMATRRPYLHTVMVFPELHTDLSIYGFIKIFSQYQSVLKSSFLILKKSKQRINT